MENNITRSSTAYPYVAGLRRSGHSAYNPRAHGGCSFKEIDHDTGRTRLVNVSAGHEEFGPWRD